MKDYETADVYVIYHLYYSRRLHPTGVFVYRVESLQPVISCLQNTQFVTQGSRFYMISCLQNTQSVTQGSRFYMRSCIQQWFPTKMDYLYAIASPGIPCDSCDSTSPQFRNSDWKPCIQTYSHQKEILHLVYSQVYGLQSLFILFILFWLP